ncbi:MAG: MotA/TolQ/ExbB proton channel family protein [Gammaproteobacteria bacterium]|nr:MotA/TolQ/ExbB proton channel family protein [Gammaproteobacteria bacterium]
MFYDAYIALSAFFAQGGNVLYLIALTTFLMWSLLFERMWYFRSEHRSVLHRVTEQWESRPERRSWSAHVIRDALISQTRERITGTYPIIITCVALCPLLGLLGTVTGMIAVFDAMATQGGNARSMAAGVSQATIPTMSGMIASLSGIFGTTFLRRRILYETEHIQDRLTMDH